MTKVKLRKKAISGARQTLYLDYYPPIAHPETGKLTRREFLKLYIYDKPKTSIEKNQNRETLALADSIRSKRQLHVQASNYGFLTSEKRKADFVNFFEECANNRIGSNRSNWHSALKYLKDFTGGSLSFSDVSEHFCNDFKQHLLTVKSRKNDKSTLSQNSAHSYFNKFKVCLKQAFKEKYISEDLNGRISPIKAAETERQYLTLEELQKLADTKCPNPLLRKVSLFAALTGLRFSDIKKLTWKEVRKNDDDYAIHYRQQKTKAVEVLPISSQAYKIMGEPGEPDHLVFRGLKYSAQLNDKLAEWIKKAEIKKKITFHCFRHTFATLQLSMGTDIYTVSKMLGHKDIKTTQVYAKIIDKTKQEAANKIQLFLS